MRSIVYVSLFRWFAAIALVHFDPQHANNSGYIPIWSKVKFIDRDPHWYTRSIKEAIYMTSPNTINRDSGFEIPKHGYLYQTTKQPIKADL